MCKNIKRSLTVKSVKDHSNHTSCIIKYSTSYRWSFWIYTFSKEVRRDVSLKVTKTPTSSTYEEVSQKNNYIDKRSNSLL